MNNEILDQLPDGLVVVGADRCITVMNRAAERMTGWSRDDAIGKPYGDVVRLRDPRGGLVHESGDPFDGTPAISHGTPEREYLLARRGGDERWVAIRTSFIKEGERIVELVATIRDTNRRHRRERSAYDLIATLAHDLRSPLTSVKGFTSTILRNWDRFPDDQKRSMLQTVDWDADRMRRLLTDLLDLSRLEAGRLELKRQEVDIVELAEQLTERIQMEAKQHTLAVEFPEEFPVVNADRSKVEQVLVNLVENAVKHGDPGKVVVSGEVLNRQIVVRVADSGPGIDARHVPYVFTKFYRRGTGERHAGTGLGLYICKGIIEAHGGQISIEKTDASGTVFAFTLPLEDS